MGLGLEQTLGARPLQRLRDFVRWISDLNERAERSDPLSVFKALIDESGYEGWLRDQFDEPVAERRIGNIRDLMAWFEKLDDQAEGGADLSDLVAKITLLDMLDRADNEEAGERITLTTLHAAKGLEFPHVFLVGFEEGILPHNTSIDEDTVEEERRLAYVGITRARKTLTITHCKQRRRYGEWEGCEPSRFLAELPEEDLEFEGGGRPVAPEVRQERGRAHLANLKALLE